MIEKIKDWIKRESRNHDRSRCNDPIACHYEDGLEDGSNHMREAMSPLVGALREITQYSDWIKHGGQVIQNVNAVADAYEKIASQALIDTGYLEGEKDD